MLFGVGLVKTAEDFGVQGESPIHPDLLDWLAVEFREGGWDTKRLLQSILATSRAYRQSSRVTPDLARRDPDNRLLARAPRLRLGAEMIRDQALASSGLLVERSAGRASSRTSRAACGRSSADTPYVARQRATACTGAASTPTGSAPSPRRRRSRSTRRAARRAASSSRGRTRRSRRSTC